MREGTNEDVLLLVFVVTMDIQRPFPLKGRFFANIFVHFEPLGPVGEDIVSIDGDLPKYIIRGETESRVLFLLSCGCNWL